MLLGVAKWLKAAIFTTELIPLIQVSDRAFKSTLSRPNISQLRQRRPYPIRGVRMLWLLASAIRAADSRGPLIEFNSGAIAAVD